MFAVGHLALGYLAGRSTSKLVHVEVNLPLLFAVSVLPDVDILLNILHRGPTHSLVTITILLIPFLVVYRKRAIPYGGALISHILIGDFFTEGTQMFWPFSSNFFGIFNINTTSSSIAITELIFFLVSLPIMYKLNDFQNLLKPHTKNWLLLLPLGEVLGPLFLAGGGLINALPILLIIPSLFYATLFSYSLFIELRAMLKKKTYKLPPSNSSREYSPVLLVSDWLLIKNRLDKSRTKEKMTRN